MADEKPVPATDEKGRFLPGNNGGPGRPKGSRNKLGEAFIEALQKDFEEHGERVIATVRDEKPDQYLKVIASLLPKEIKIEAVNDLSDDELDRRIRHLAAALSLEIGVSVTASGEAAQDGAAEAVGLPAVH